AARVINRCDDALGGSLLSAIAVAGEPPTRGQDAGHRVTAARKILQMLPPSRHGPLLNHMSSIALASVLALPPVPDAVRLCEGADIATIVGALSEMPPDRTSTLIVAMDANRATQVLRLTAPARVADILRSVSPADRRQELLSRLPDQFRTAAIRH